MTPIPLQGKTQIQGLPAPRVGLRSRSRRPRLALVPVPEEKRTIREGWAWSAARRLIPNAGIVPGPQPERMDITTCAKPSARVAVSSLALVLIYAYYNETILQR